MLLGYITAAVFVVSIIGALIYEYRQGKAKPTRTIRRSTRRCRHSHLRRRHND